MNRFVSFSKHLTRRIVLLLTLTLSVLFAVLISLTAITSYSMQKSYFNSIMDVESEIVEGMLHGVELSVQSNASDIVIECAGLNYISSSGLRLMLDVYKHASANGHNAFLAHLSDEIRDIFDISGFLQLFKIEK